MRPGANVPGPGKNGVLSLTGSFIAGAGGCYVNLFFYTIDLRTPSETLFGDRTLGKMTIRSSAAVPIGGLQPGLVSRSITHDMVFG